MPPTSKTIFASDKQQPHTRLNKKYLTDILHACLIWSMQEEGAQIKSFKIVNQGEYDRDGLVKLLVEDPAQ